MHKETFCSWERLFKSSLDCLYHYRDRPNSIRCHDLCCISPVTKGLVVWFVFKANKNGFQNSFQHQKLKLLSHCSLLMVLRAHAGVYKREKIPGICNAPSNIMAMLGQTKAAFSIQFLKEPENSHVQTFPQVRYRWSIKGTGKGSKVNSPVPQ